MIIKTKYLGDIEINKLNIIEFPSGVPGFIEERQFVLLDLPGNAAFQILQSITNEDLAFIVTNPYHFYHDYEFKLHKEIRNRLKIDNVEDVMILAIVTLKDSLYKSTLNLKAPLIINVKQNYGKQYILNDDRYSMRAALAPPEAMKAKGD